MHHTIRQAYGLNPVTGEVGVEVEMEGNFGELRGPPKFPWRWEVDGSLRGENLEFILRSPRSVLEAQSAVDKLYKMLEAKDHVKIRPSRRCGVHIHINCQSMTEWQVFHMMLLYLTFEELLVAWAGPDRAGNLFCLRASDAEDLVLKMAECRMHGSLKYMANDGYRYASVNVAALAKFGSLEFRALATPSKPGRIKTWIRMLHRLKTHALKGGSWMDVVTDMSALGCDEYIAQVMGRRSPLLGLGEPAEREEMLLRGVRHAQDAILLRPAPQGRVPPVRDPFHPQKQARAPRWQPMAPRPAPRYQILDEVPDLPPDRLGEILEDIAERGRQAEQEFIDMPNEDDENA
jgi:hypothetical protein